MELSFVSYADNDESLLEGFRRIYMDAFPDIDEREPYDNIKRRISSSDSRPGTVACLLTDGGKVVGGLLSDFYVFSESSAFDLEAIYIAVDKDSRRTGYGRKLLTDGLELSASRLEKLTGMKLRNIYFETENPFKVKKESFDPISRLRFFSSLGAMRIPIDYRQPPLDDASGWADNLFLMVLPHPGKKLEPAVGAEDLKAFLAAFYQGLAVSDESCYEAFRKEIDKVAEVDKAKNGIVKLDALSETPSFLISDVSVLSHYRMKGCRFSEEDESDLKTCPVFESYECDLMDYAHQARECRPFRTYHIKSYRDVRLSLPKFYSFTSEGHTFYHLSHIDSIEVDISLNCSSRGNAVDEDERYIVSLAVRPSEGSAFDELTLIKLVTMFGSRQENYFAYPYNNFTDLCVNVGDGERAMSVFEFIGHYMADCGERLIGTPQFECCHTGTTELELSSVRRVGVGYGHRVFTEYSEFYEQVASSSPAESLWNKTLCGILLGIFDFVRMNSAEIFDTIKPMVERKSSFMLSCRGHLMKVCFEQNKERVENIFISPYLMIPSVALAYNEMILDGCEASLAAIKADDSGGYIRFYAKIKNDTSALQNVRHLLSLQYIPNCFNYPSEREIFLSRENRLGLRLRLGKLKKDMEMAQNEINQRKSRYSVFIETIQNCILVILAILQVYTAVNKLHWLFISFLVLTIIFGADIAYKKLKE